MTILPHPSTAASINHHRGFPLWGQALATTILLAGAAFLYMLARNIKTPGSHVASGKRILGRTIVPTLAVVVLLRTFLLQSFQVATNAATPEIPRGSLVLVWKPTRTFEAGELIAYVANGRVNLGRIDKPSREAVFVKRNDSKPTSVLHSDIVGKVMSVLWRASAPSGVTQFDIAPLGLSNNVVLVDVTAEVAQGHAELRAVLDGPESPATNMVPLFAGTLVKPAQDTVNHPFRILWPGRQMWRLAFVLPDAALAKKAFEDIRPIGALPAVGDRTMAGTIFEVRDANGQKFHATLQVALPFTSNDPNPVSVFGHCQNTESVVTLTWEVLASGSGLAQFSSVGSPILALRHNPQTMLHGVIVRLELIQAGANRVQFVRHIGGDPIREELDGNFRDLAVELLRTASFGAKATSGMRIELCRFQGKPFTVQVDVPVSTVTTSVPMKSVAWSVTFFSGIGLFLVAVIVLFVALVRKAGSTARVVLLIASLPVVFLIVSLGLYSTAQARRARDAAHRAMAAARAEMEVKLTAAVMGAVSKVQTDKRSATIDAHVNAGEELLVFIGDESLGWASSSPKAGTVTATVEASSEMRLDDGSLGQGLIIRTSRGTTGGPANVAITPDGPVPFGTLVFRANVAVSSRDGIFTFADIHKADGTLVPVSVRVRKGQTRVK